MAQQTRGMHDVPTSQRSTAELIHDFGDQLTRLVRTEMRLAQRELQQKGKEAGKGAAMFGAAGVVALLGVAVLITTAVLALALVLPPWLSALIVGAALLLVAGVIALVSRARMRRASPPLPEETLDSVQQDFESMRRATRR